MGEFPQALVAAAQYERDRRARRSPALIAAGTVSDDDATLDYQAWCAIAAWFETGQFAAIEAGGIDGQTLVGWARCEQAAANTLALLTGEADAMADDPAADQAKLERLRLRRANVLCIHRAVQLRRQSVDAINAEFRDRREREIA